MQADEISDQITDETDDAVGQEGPTVQVAEPDRIDVRRNLGLSAAVGALAAVLAMAFCLRAFSGAALLDWVAFGLLTVIAVVFLTATLDSRAPLLVADRQGVRLRHGSKWEGIAWSEVDCLEHLPRRLPFRDGHLLVVGADQAQQVVPLTLATRLVGTTGHGMSDDLAALAAGRADVVEVVPGLDEIEDDAAEATTEITRVPVVEAERTGDLGDSEGTENTAIRPIVGEEPRADDFDDVADTAIRPIVREEPRGDGFDAAEDAEDAEDTAEVPDPDGGREGPATAIAARDRGSRHGLISSLIHRGTRGSARRTPTIGANALLPEVEEHELPEATELRRIAAEEALEAGDGTGEEWGLAGVRVIDPGPSEQTVTVVLGDLQVTPADDPVIGPQLQAARERLRLSIDQLAERTRVRPHVIESMEADDFAPCGGDFYARGHLRTVSRVLGLEAAPLVAAYDDKYADAPVDPRRVFESELATGVGGSIRGTRGGRNWSVLVAAVMAAVLLWSIATLVMDGPVPIGDQPVLNQSGGISNGAATQGKAVPVTLTAVSGGARLVVRDGAGDVVFEGTLAFGQTSKLDVVPPVRIWSSDGSVTSSLDGADAKPLGETGAEVTKTLVP